MSPKANWLTIEEIVEEVRPDDELIIDLDNAHNEPDITVSLFRLNSRVQFGGNTNLIPDDLVVENVAVEFMAYRLLFFMDGHNENSNAFWNPRYAYDIERFRSESISTLVKTMSESGNKTPKTFQPKNKGLVVETFDWNEEEVLDDEEVTQVKVLMALADDELTVGKNHARNGEWIDITMRKVERLNPDSKLPNFNTERILVPESQAVNESLKPTETSITPKSFKDSEAESLILLPPLKNLLGVSPSSEDSLNKSVSGTITVSETEATTPLVPTEVKDTEQESKINELTKVVQMLIDEKGTIFNANKEIVLIAPRRNNVYVFDMSSLTPYGACFFAKASEISQMSINHEKYTIVIVDEYSRYTWVHFLKNKSQAPKMIMCFIKMVEDKNDVKVKQIKTDNGTEFRKHELESFCDEKGFSQNFAFPYTHEQNGVAERNNRTLIEVARIMLNGSVLSKNLWTQAVRIACYT
ncbi:retrovirus-related pol polyprotein from transposon TNT 1-94 [Tanacetum coccineum]